MRAKSKLIERAGTFLLPIFLQREKIKAYQSPEEDSYDFVITMKNKFIRLKLKSINGDSENPSASKITEKQHENSNFVIVYLLDGNRNRFFTIPTSRTPRNSNIRFSKRKNGEITGKWTKYEGFDYLKKDLKK